MYPSSDEDRADAILQRWLKELVSDNGALISKQEASIIARIVLVGLMRGTAKKGAPLVQVASDSDIATVEKSRLVAP